MSSGGKKSKGFSMAKWFDEWSLSLQGILLVTRVPRFWAFFIPVFIIFGTLLNLLSGGTAAFDLMGALDFPGKLKVIFDAFLGIFGVSQNFLDWLLVFAITILQATLIGVIAVVWKHNKDQAEGLQSSGIAAGLAILGSGCPTCGTALVTPIIGAIFSGSSYVVAGVVSGVVTALAIIVAVLALRRVGLNAYAVIKAEKRQERKKGGDK